MDRIIVHAIACQVHLGVPEQERSQPQPVEIDLVLGVDLSAAASSDDVRDTIDYQKLVDQVRHTAMKGPVRLIETLADRICQLVLSDSRVQEISVRVRKFPAILAGKTGRVEVEMRRKQPAG